jgi:hypothetical protein
MSAVSTQDPQLQTALQNCFRALRGMADYTLPPALDRYIRELGERKEFLNAADTSNSWTWSVSFSSARATNSRPDWPFGNCNLFSQRRPLRECRQRS